MVSLFRVVSFRFGSSGVVCSPLVVSWSSVSFGVLLFIFWYDPANSKILSAMSAFGYAGFGVCLASLFTNCVVVFTVVCRHPVGDRHKWFP